MATDLLAKDPSRRLADVGPTRRPTSKFQKVDSPLDTYPPTAQLFGPGEPCCEYVKTGLASRIDPLTSL